MPVIVNCFHHMAPSATIPLSVAFITLNEEERLPDCLASVAFARDIVVVDSGSTDKTVAIAEAHGARIFHQPWQGFGPQKQFAIDRCANPWVLILDADERVPEETAAEIRATLAGSPRHAAYSLPRRNYFLGRWIRHAGWWPDRTVRLFRRDCCRMPPQLVHEALAVNGSVGEIQNPLLHQTSRNLQEVLRKINHYSTAGAQELYRQGEGASLVKAVLRAWWAFVHNYFFRFGLLDGSPGLIIAVSDAVNKFYKYAKLKELHDHASDRGEMR